MNNGHKNVIAEVYGASSRKETIDPLEKNLWWRLIKK
jgi:hypothetical protein